jgi:hypothetical protein
MEKIRDSIHKKLPPLLLYLEEVDEFYQFISGIAKDVTFEVEGYRLNSPEELKKLPVNHIHNLQINSSRPFIKLDLRPYSAEIFIGNGDVEAEGIASRIENILLSGRAPVYFVPSGFFSGILASVPLWIGLALKNNLISGLGIAFVTVWATLLSIDYQFRLKQYTTVSPMKRKELPSFWARNKDQIWLLIIGAVIGAVITKIATLY